jgi:hypothetical protein
MKKKSQITAEYVRNFDAVVENLKNSVIILKHNAAIFEIHPSLQKDICLIDDPRLMDRKEWANMDVFPGLFIEIMSKATATGKKILVMDYSLAASIILEYLLDDETFISAPCVCMTFFHNDAESKVAFWEGICSIMDVKNELMESMANFPFIKKFTIPLFYTINQSYLNQLRKAAI